MINKINKLSDVTKHAKRILVTCTQYPYYGGAATNAYALIKFFRRNNYKTAGIFFTHGEDQKGNIDPEKIGGICNCKVDKLIEKDYLKSVKKFIIEYLNGLPEVIFAKNYYAPIGSKKLFSKVPLIYLVSGSPQMMTLAKDGISAKKHIKEGIPIKYNEELLAINTSDITIANSLIGNELLIKNYGLSNLINPIDTSFAMNSYKANKKPFDERIYDIGFICSDFNRHVKNPELAVKLLNNSAFKDKKKIIVGINSTRLGVITNGEVVGYVNNSNKMLDILRDTKVILCTSYYDASPNVIKEAILCGCNFLLSENCGWSEIYPKEFVCEDVYDISEWIRKLNYLVKNDIDYSFDYETFDSKLLSGLHLK